jgi:acyl carrier protein
MSVPVRYQTLSAEAIREQLRGFPVETVEAALQFQSEGSLASFKRMLPGFIEFHLPRGTPKPPAVLEDHLRLNQDLGLDSLALSEMAFKFDELFGVTIETREVTSITTVGELLAFLKTKFDLE